MAQVVFIVTSGSYSDYSINRVFSTRDLAEKWIRLHVTSEYQDQYDKYEIEEWEMDPDDDMGDIKRGMTRYGVGIRDDGQSGIWTADGPVSEFVYELNHWFPGGRWVGVVEARDYQHALKIANEKVGMLKAREAGIS